MPLFIFLRCAVGQIGRKKIMLAGMLAGAILYVPIYHGMVSASNTGVVKLKKVIVPGEHEPKLASLNSEGRPSSRRRRPSFRPA